MPYPAALKSAVKKVPVLNVVLENYLKRRRAGRTAQARAEMADVLSKIQPELPLPKGVSERDLFRFVTSVCVAGAPPEEMKNYGTHDFKRFVYTYGLALNETGKCLELGANPYFTTMLLEEFTDLELSLANYFGGDEKGAAVQSVDYIGLRDGAKNRAEFSFSHFNIENDEFPWGNDSFDLVIFAEIIEHLLNDPCKVLREIKRVLKPNGALILTTPNVARLENISRLVSGSNIYDPYSGYGPYGRHNREYNVHELVSLLRYEGFEVTEHFTADVHANNSALFSDLSKIIPLVDFRAKDLGQYIFIKARNCGSPAEKRPSWLYRSLPEGSIQEVAL